MKNIKLNEIKQDDKYYRDIAAIMNEFSKEQIYTPQDVITILDKGQEKDLNISKIQLENFVPDRNLKKKVEETQAMLDKIHFSNKLISKKKNAEDISFKKNNETGNDCKENDASPPKTKEDTKDTGKGSKYIDLTATTSAKDTGKGSNYVDLTATTSATTGVTTVATKGNTTVAIIVGTTFLI